MTCTDVLEARIDAAIQTLRALRDLREGRGENPALRDAHQRLTLQMEALAAARAMCHRAPRLGARAEVVGTVTTDCYGVITRIDRALASLLRRDRAALVGSSLGALVALPDRRRFGHHLCELVENPELGEWQTRLSRNGSLLSVSVALRVVVLPESRRLRWSVRDLRELRRAQSETFARMESVRGATRLLRRLARESSRLSRRMTPGLPGLEHPASN